MTTLTAVPVPHQGGDALGGFVLLHTDTAGLWQRSVNDGSTWQTVRNGDVDADTVVYDYEAPFTVPLVYRLVVAAVEQARTPAVTLTSPTPWLGSVLVPSLGVPVTIAAVRDLVRPLRAVAHDVIGRPDRVTVSDVLQLRQGTLTLHAAPADGPGLERVLAPGAVLLLRTTRPDVLAPLYLTPTTGLTDDPLSDTVVHWRRRSFGFVEVPSPAGSTTVVPAAIRTWQQVADRGTWLDVLVDGLVP